ncbi:hypothetical protein [Undibacterium sp. Di24W]|uniref:hypothetical protein n=1 Tax=Undibacterium sp. Di24W TaxID=3413033 RepID=UPI003BF364E3
MKTEKEQIQDLKNELARLREKSHLTEDVKELSQLQKRIDASGWNMVMGTARDCAELFPSKQIHLQLVIGGRSDQ